MGFQTSRHRQLQDAYAEKLFDRIPVEVLARFNPKPITISPPSREDLWSALSRIHAELSVPKMNIEHLVDEAEGCKASARWLENHVPDLLINNSLARHPVEDDEETVEDRIVDMVSGDVHHYFREVVAKSNELRVPSCGCPECRRHQVAAIFFVSVHMCFSLYYPEDEFPSVNKR